MIRRTKVNPTRVRELARTQVEALKANPALLEIVSGLPEEIEARLAEASTTEDAHEHLSQAAKIAKQSAQDEMFDLRQVLVANIELVADYFGVSATEVGLLGGKPQPIRRVRRKSKDAPVAATGDK